MQSLALTTDRDYYTRAANEDCINGGPRTRTKFFYDNVYRLDHSILGGVTNLQMGYDAMGDITSRSDVAGGATWTYDPVRKHAVTQAGNSSFTYAYDANGNVTSRNGSIVGWTSYNYPDGVTTATESATFDYGPDRQRWRMIYSGPSGNETTFYATPKFEKVYAGGGGEYRSYIYAGNRPVVVVMRNTASQIIVRSLLVDHQGSISSIVTDSTGTSLVGESFTAYGNRREASTWTGAPTSAELATMNGVTREGYTFQTVLGSMGLNHMNGRIEDSVTGRFLSPDPRGIIQGNTQSWNRYSYVLNNPVTLTDPTGHNPFKRCSGDFCPTQNPGRKQYYDVGSLGPTSNNTSGLSDGMQGWTGSDSGGDIGSVGYNGDNGGTGIGGATAVAYAAASTPNTPGGSADDDPELQPIVVTATRIGDNGHPPLSAQSQSTSPDSQGVRSVLGPESLPLAGEGVLARIIGVVADLLGLGSSNDTPASTPVGRSGNPMNVEPGTNSPGSVNGTDYSGHAFDQMQGRGIPPSAVDNTIETGVTAPGNLPGTTTSYDAVNNLTVVTNSNTGRVITVRPGPP